MTQVTGPYCPSPSSPTRSFSFGEFPFDVLDLDGEPWFVASQVCDALGINNPRQALARLDDDEKGVTTADTPGGKQQVSTISESGLYSLILRSRKPAAKAFKRWVTHEVLPSIRRTGSYSTPTADRVKLINSAIRAAEAAGALPESIARMYRHRAMVAQGKDSPMPRLKFPKPQPSDDDDEVRLPVEVKRLAGLPSHRAVVYGLPKGVYDGVQAGDHEAARQALNYLEDIKDDILRGVRIPLKVVLRDTERA